MEYFWYIAAALGAGIGTGLAGLSAATVMVPVLIVLCPSFAGETGAYHATTIALASDILGAAVTTAIYIRHKNIDLKRGWVMLVCIVGMCVAGSFAAWSAGNVVLGGFSLFLTFFIGIRFLLKPDTQKEQTVEKGAGLDRKGLAISLFFGLTIGLGRASWVPAASIVSARFANKVNSRTAGLATGGILTVLGAAMLILNYWKQTG